MLEAARAVVGERAEYAVADVRELPFGDETFDVVIANHMLYHVSDRSKAFAQISRVLVRGGVVHASTNGRAHLRQLQELVPEWELSAHMEEFGLETGSGQLEPFFTVIRIERYAGRLDVTDAEPVLAYIRSSNTYRGQPLDGARALVEEALARDGVFGISTDPGLITARKP
jgi:SAM-dependent methyltransferase